MFLIEDNCSDRTWSPHAVLYILQTITIQAKINLSESNVLDF